MMRRSEISEVINNIYKSGKSLNQNNIKITERASQLEEAMINLKK